MKITFRNMSIVSLCLLGVSTITSAFMPSREADEQNGAFAPGIAGESTGGSAFSAVLGAGAASYTATGISATGADLLTLTNDNAAFTGNDTTRVG